MIPSPLPGNVARYYDRNTRRFLRLGGSGEAAAIHRQVWGPGVTTSQAAFLYLNGLVARAIAPQVQSAPGQPEAQVLDLGCGVGGTATWLAQELCVQVTGVTISPVQQQIAAERAQRLGQDNRCRFLLADFLDLPEIGLFQAAYAIESFAHAANPGRFFEQAAGRLAPGGRLVICDDFQVVSADKRALPWLERFQQGWQIRCLLDREMVIELAGDAGLCLSSSQNLTPYLRPLHPRLLRLMAWITRLPLPGAYWQNLSGGMALQICIQQGWTEYHALVFEKEGPCTA